MPNPFQSMQYLRQQVSVNVVVAVVALLTMGLGVDHFVRPTTYSYRYKLTIEALIDDEVKRASNVVEVSESLDFYNSRQVSVHGEALYMDLGPGKRPLIALLTAQPKNNDYTRAECQWGDGGPTCIEKLYGIADPKWNLETRKMEGFELFSQQRGPREISIDRLPDLVTFGDIRNPKSILAVDPKDPGKALGVKFEWRHITLEVTSEPVTAGIQKRLSWLKDYYDRALDGKMPGESGPEFGLASRMTTIGFLRGTH